MANEYLKRTPTSTGNRRVFTWSGWIKKEAQSTNATIFEATLSGEYRRNFLTLYNGTLYYGAEDPSATTVILVGSDALFRDNNSWYHIIWSIDTTTLQLQDRVRIYVNGVQARLNFTTTTNLSINTQQAINGTGEHNIGKIPVLSNTEQFSGYLADVFFVDGQALTPDIFGFYKDGKGYISAGTSQSTDFRPGQWVPKSPRVIKSEINRRGGFGVNGFYLPMNSSNNFGADFHTTPDTILRLKEALPQPKAEIDGSGDYTNALRDDPFKQYLVLAIPFVSGGLQNGFGDYSAAIKGSGSPKTITNSNVSISNSISNYYGSSGSFNGTGSQLTIPATSDFDLSSSDFTIEMWARPNVLKNGNSILSLGTGGNSLYWVLVVGQSSGAIAFGSGNGGWGWTTQPVSQGTQVRINQWNHVAVVRKSNVLTTYLNGVAIGVTTNHNFGSGFGGNLHIGSYFQNYNNDGSWFDGYIQDLRVYKGVAKYTGGFDVPRPYTPVGIATWRAVPDTIANNFTTLNGTSIPSKYTVSNGNLTFANSTSNWTGWLEGTIGFSSGKYYWETRIDVSTDYHHIGIVGVGVTHFNTTDAYKYGVSYQADGRYWAENNNLNGFQTGITQSKTVGDIVMLAVDMTNKKMWIGKNGTWFSGDPATGSNAPFDSTVGFNYTHYVPFYDSYGSSGLSINFGQNPTFSGNTSAGTFTDSNGKGLFKYQPPAGFLALCSDNLPEPVISDPGEHFKTVLYTGDGNSGRSITGVGFKPDLVWIKPRNFADNHVIYDSVRGAMKGLYSNGTNAEFTGSGNGLTSFDSDGFSSNSFNNINDTGDQFVAWCWRAGGEAVTNTNGTITSQVSVNQDAGFSIVSYTGNGSSGATVGHGINKPPKFVIVQTRQGTNNKDKPVYHVSTGTNYATVLNSTSAGFTNSAFWNNTAPSSSLITLGNDQNTNQNTSTYIAYCWAEIEGYSKFGSYVGNGSDDGPFIYCGFKPAFVMRKMISNTGSWEIIDSSRSSTNAASRYLYADVTIVESDVPNIDLLSNGFKCRTAATGLNTSGSTYIFAAFAESPFQTANAK